MTINPLIQFRPAEPSRSIDAHVEWLNGLNFVAASGKPYFVNQRTRPGGEIEHFVDRKL